MTPMPETRYMHSSIIKRGKLIVLGGVGGDYNLFDKKGKNVVDA